MTSLNNQSNSGKDVYFLGAGASVSAGVPTFSNFRDKSSKIFKEILAELAENEPEDSYSQPFIESEDSKIFRHVLAYWSTHFNELNIEDFYTAIEMNETLMTNSDKVNSETISTDDIVKFIYFTIKKSIKNTINSDNLYESFHSHIEHSGAIVITTNWDIVLESSNPYILEDGWINYESVQAHSMSFNKEKPTKEYELLKEFTQYHILKLHGSLNWGFCDNCGQIYYFNKKIYDELTSYGIECNNIECREKHVKLKSVIVPPTLSKLVNPVQITKSKSPKLAYFQL